MARTICIANQKGGVGKTTTTVNLSSALAQIGKRVLIIDLDPQGNASSGLGIKKYENSENNIYHVLVGERSLSQVIQPTAIPNLKIAPANPDLVGAEIELVDMPRREYRLKSAIETVTDDYDYVIIDCPPSLGLLTVNALSSANSFLVPLQCEYYALEGLSQLLNTAGIIKKNLNPELKIEGIVLTMFDARNNLSHQVVTEIQNHFGDKVFSAIIPRNVRLSEAPSHGQSIFEYDAKSIGAKKYLEFANELSQRVDNLLNPEVLTAEPPPDQEIVQEMIAEEPAARNPRTQEKDTQELNTQELDNQELDNQNIDVQVEITQLTPEQAKDLEAQAATNEIDQLVDGSRQSIVQQDVDELNSQLVDQPNAGETNFAAEAETGEMVIIEQSADEDVLELEDGHPTAVVEHAGQTNGPSIDL